MTCEHSKKRERYPAYRIFLDQIKWADYVGKLKYSYTPTESTGEDNSKTGRGTCWFVGWESDEKTNDTFFLMTCEHLMENGLTDGMEITGCTISFGDSDENADEIVEIKILGNIRCSKLDYALLKVKPNYDGEETITFPRDSGLGKLVSNYTPELNENLIMFGFPGTEGNHKLVDYCEITSKECLRYCRLKDNQEVYDTRIKNKKHRIFYHCNSFKGGSGSPCFSQNGVLVCMHAGGDGEPDFRYERGVELSKCVEDIQQKLQTQDANTYDNSKISKDTLQRLFPQVPMTSDSVQNGDGENKENSQPLPSTNVVNSEIVDSEMKADIDLKLSMKCLKMLDDMTKLIGTVHTGSDTGSFNSVWVIWLNKPSELYIVCAEGKNWNKGDNLSISFDNEWQSSVQGNALSQVGRNAYSIQCSGAIHCTEFNMSLFKMNLTGKPTENQRLFEYFGNVTTLGYTLHKYKRDTTLNRVAFLLSGVPHSADKERFMKCIDFCHIGNCCDLEKKSIRKKPFWWNKDWVEMHCKDYAAEMNIVGSPCILPVVANYREIMGICYKKENNTTRVVNLYTFISKIKDAIKREWDNEVFESLQAALKKV